MYLLYRSCLSFNNSKYLIRNQLKNINISLSSWILWKYSLCQSWQQNEQDYLIFKIYIVVKKYLHSKDGLLSNASYRCCHSQDKGQKSHECVNRHYSRPQVHGESRIQKRCKPSHPLCFDNKKSMQIMLLQQKFKN